MKSSSIFYITIKIVKKPHECVCLNRFVFLQVVLKAALIAFVDLQAGKQVDQNMLYRGQ